LVNNRPEKDRDKRRMTSKIASKKDLKKLVMKSI